MVFISNMKNPSPEEQLRRKSIPRSLSLTLSVAFTLYDENNDGLLTLEDLTKHLLRPGEVRTLFGMGDESFLIECVAEVHQFVGSE